MFSALISRHFIYFCLMWYFEIIFQFGQDWGRNSEFKIKILKIISIVKFDIFGTAPEIKLLDATYRMLHKVHFHI